MTTLPMGSPRRLTAVYHAEPAQATRFGELKRSIDGTYHHVSNEHLPRYLAEFGFRCTTCKDTDTERMRKMVARVAGRVLTYRQPGKA